MALRHSETQRFTGASLGFGKTLLSASYNLFLTFILTSVINPRTPVLRALEPEPTPAKLEDETRDPAHENKKKEEHLYPIAHHPTTALFPVSLALRERYTYRLLFFIHFLFYSFSDFRRPTSSLAETRRTPLAAERN